VTELVFKLNGVAVKLALWRFINDRDDVATDQALAAYDAIKRLTGRDFCLSKTAPGRDRGR
jgi:hypothetical protein